VVIAEDALCVQATLDTTGSICQGGVYFAYYNEGVESANLKYILGILNSSLMNCLIERYLAECTWGAGTSDFELVS